MAIFRRRTVTGGDSSSIDRGSPNFGKPSIVTVPVSSSTPQTGIKPSSGGSGSSGGRPSSPSAGDSARINAEIQVLEKQKQEATAIQKEAEEKKIQQEAEEKKIQQEAFFAEQQKIAIQAKINQQNMKLTSQKQPDIPKIEIQTQPYIEARQTGFYRDENTGAKIPTRTLVYVDPTGIGVQKERPATDEERKQYYSEERSSGAFSTEKTYPTLANLKGGISNSFANLNTGLREAYTNSINPEAIGQATKEAIKTPIYVLSGNKEIYNVKDPVTEFAGGFTKGVAEDIKYKPLKNIVLVGAGYGIGFASAGVGTAVSSIPKVGAYAGTAYRVTEFGAGAYLGGKFVMQTSTQIMAAETAEQKGSITGVSLKDAALVGMGYKGGQSGYQKVQGYFSTFGREEIPTASLIPKDVLSGKKKFVESPTGRINAKEYKMLFEKQSQVIPGIKDPIGYQSTPTKFWKDTLDVTMPGSSEFSGLYVAYRPSPYFLKVGASSSSGGFNPKAFLKNLLQPYGRPGTAGIIPTKFVIGKNSKVGEAFIPAIKPEVEAIFPVGTKASLINKGYYYTWEGVKIPLDVFKAVSSETKGATNIKSIMGSGSYSSLSGSTSALVYAPSVKSSSYSSVSYSLPVNTFSSSNKSSGSSSKASSLIYGSSGGSGSKSYSPSYKAPSLTSKGSSSLISKTSSKKPYPYSSKKSGGSSSSIFGSYKSPAKRIGFPKQKQFRQPKSSGMFSVSVRRFGKFKTIGTATTLSQAFEIGEQKAKGTLARTFKVSGGGTMFKTPKGFYAKTSKKEGRVFIQKAKWSLSSIGERTEINQFRRMTAR